MGLIYFFITAIILFQFVIVYAIAEVYFSCKNTAKNTHKRVNSLSERVFIIIGLFIALGLLIFSIYSPAIFTSQLENSLQNNIASEGQLGDKIGGLMNPFISMAAVIVTGLAFYAQIKANKLVQNQFKIQQFEDQFYEMLEIHIETVRSMDISNTITGKKCFTRMFSELKLIGKVCEHYWPENSNKTNKQTEISDVMYKIFFYGNGHASDKLIDKIKYKKIFDCLKVIEEYYNNNLNKKINYVTFNISQILNSEDSFEIDLQYYPFDGHVNRLGTYFRHLFLLVTHVVNSEIITSNEKYKYIKLIRAQLSNHEQLIIYYNSLASFGKSWHDKKYFTEFRLIKNLPFELADFGCSPKEKFKDYLNKEDLMVNSLGKPIFDEYEKY